MKLVTLSKDLASSTPQDINVADLTPFTRGSNVVLVITPSETAAGTVTISTPDADGTTQVDFVTAASLADSQVQMYEIACPASIRINRSSATGATSFYLLGDS